MSKLVHRPRASLRRLLLFAAAGLSTLLTGSAQKAQADVADRLPRLTRLHADAASARGPLAYVALRRLWAEWDRGDPAEVEEVLHEIAADVAEPWPARGAASRGPPRR
ncbi:MAG: hypothetical protein JOZ69_01665, partial [Myxococcales bacterium]|nr:hypothetical protein [Myxococcales bacterium]